MFLRLVSHNVRQGQATALAEAYNDNITSVLRQQPGCVFVSLLQNVTNQKECVSLTIWNSKTEADEYERTGVFKQLFDLLVPYFEESNEFTMALNENLSIEYVPVPIEPNVARFDDDQTKKEYITRFNAAPYAAQIIRLSIPSDKSGEFEETFESTITAKYRGHKGFIHLILLRNKMEYTIISFWDETFDFQGMSSEGIEGLTREIFAFLPDDVQSRLSKKQTKLSTVSSNDIQSFLYRCLTAEWTKQ